MIVGCSKELYKVEVDFNKFDATKLQSHEVFGLYLIGEISFRKLKEIFRIESEDDLKKTINQVCLKIDNASNKNEDDVEIDF